VELEVIYHGSCGCFFLLNSAEGAENVNEHPIKNRRGLGCNSQRVPSEYNSTALLLQKTAEDTGVVNSITEFFVAFY
jgi:hypothetical protein